MNEEPDQRPSQEPSEAEMGLPIGELAQIREPASPGFFGKVRGSIERRRLGSELADLSWNGVLSVMLEFVDLAVQLVTGTQDKRR